MRAVIYARYSSDKICNNKIYVSIYSKRQMINFFEELGYSYEENDCLIFTKDVANINRTIQIDLTLFNEDEKIKRLKEKEEVEQYISIKELPIIDENQLPF